jgi:hypothetical protein
LPFLLIKQKRVGQLIRGKLAKNRYKCTNVVMEHDHIGHHLRPTWPHANSRPHMPTKDSSDFDNELRKRDMQVLRRPSPPQATGCSSSLLQGHSTAAPAPLINLVKSQNLQSLTKYKEKI